MPIRFKSRSPGGFILASRDGSFLVSAEAPVCTPLSFTKVLPLETPLTLVDVVPYAGGALALVSGDSLGLQLVDENLGVIPLVSDKPRNAALSRSQDGTVCATWAPLAEGPLHRACSPDFAVVEHGGVIEVEAGMHVAESDGFGPIAFFRGDFASADAAVLREDTWSQVELFESSVSSFGDALSDQGLAYACLLASGDRVAIIGEQDIGLGLRSLERLVTDPTPSIKTCRLDVTGNELSAVFVDSNNEAFRGTATVGSTGVASASWSSESVATDINRRFDYAATTGEYAIVYRNDDNGENVVRWNRGGTWETQNLTEGENMSYPRAFYDGGGSLYVATSGTVDGEFGIGFYRFCAD